MTIREVIVLHMLNAFEYMEAARTQEAMSEFMMAYHWAQKRPQFKNTAEFCLQRAEILEFMLNNGIEIETIPLKPDTQPSIRGMVVADEATFNAGFTAGLNHAYVWVDSVLQNPELSLEDANPSHFVSMLRKVADAARKAWQYDELNK